MSAGNEKSTGWRKLFRRPPQRKAERVPSFVNVRVPSFEQEQRIGSMMRRLGITRTEAEARIQTAIRNSANKRRNRPRKPPPSSVGL